MYSNVHGTAGALLVLAGCTVSDDPVIGATAGGLAAFFSHDLLDRLGEKSYGPLKVALLWEGLPLLLFASVAYLSGSWWIYALGWVLGNLMDIIDKKLYLSILFPNKFGPSISLFPCHDRRPDIDLTLDQTKSITIVSSMAILLTL